jgi:Fe-S-cluster containining protein
MSLFAEDLPPCAGCGSCCHLAVELMPGDDGVPEDLVFERDGIRFMDQRGSGACVALDPLTRLCTIYDRRPATCRMFARGEALCRMAVVRFSGAPAAGKGSPA